MEYRQERGKMLLSRRNQLLLEFSFWNEPVPRDGPNIYELRSYQLRVSICDSASSLALGPCNMFIIVQISHAQVLLSLCWNYSGRLLLVSFNSWQYVGYSVMHFSSALAVQLDG